METEISARVKSEESSESAKEIRAVSPTVSEEELAEIAMVGGVVSPVLFSLRFTLMFSMFMPVSTKVSSTSTTPIEI